MRLLLDETTYRSLQPCWEGVLGRSGLSVDLAESGPDAYEKVQLDPPDTVVVHGHLSGGGAAQLFHAIRTKLHLKGVQLCGILPLSDEDLVDDFKKCGCNQVIFLPLTPEVLMAEIASVNELPFRAAQRFPFRKKIATRFTEEIFELDIMDISANGLSFVTSLYMEDWTPLVHRFVNVRAGREHILFSEVVRSTYRHASCLFEYGCRFTDLTENDRRFLQCLCATPIREIACE